jgi:general secretion pathway protein I
VGVAKMTKNQCNKGFTLLEVIIAVAIIAIALTTLLGSQSQSVSFANSAKFETMAALLAQSKMSEIVIQEADSLFSDSGDFGDDYPGYAWDVTISDISIEGVNSISDYLKQVDLTVTWGVFSYNVRLYHYVGESNFELEGSDGSNNVFAGMKRTGIAALSSAYHNINEGTKDSVTY